MVIQQRTSLQKDGVWLGLFRISERKATLHPALHADLRVKPLKKRVYEARLNAFFLFFR
jgi:hypothetical protein